MNSKINRLPEGILATLNYFIVCDETNLEAELEVKNLPFVPQLDSAEINPEALLAMLSDQIGDIGFFSKPRMMTAKEVVDYLEFEGDK